MPNSNDSSPREGDDDKLGSTLDETITGTHSKYTADPNNPLSSANDNWTGNPAIDRERLVQRARQAARRDEPIRPYDPLPHRRMSDWLARLRDWLSR